MTSRRHGFLSSKLTICGRCNPPQRACSFTCGRAALPWQLLVGLELQRFLPPCRSAQAVMAPAATATASTSHCGARDESGYSGGCEAGCVFEAGTARSAGCAFAPRLCPWRPFVVVLTAARSVPVAL